MVGPIVIIGVQIGSAKLKVFIWTSPSLLRTSPVKPTAASDQKSDVRPRVADIRSFEASRLPGRTTRLGPPVAPSGRGDRLGATWVRHHQLLADTNWHLTVLNFELLLGRSSSKPIGKTKRIAFFFVFSATFFFFSQNVQIF